MNRVPIHPTLMLPGPVPRTDEQRAKRIQLAEEDIFFFASYYVPHYFDDRPPAFHRELMALARKTELDRRQRNTAGLVVAAPRGHAKSTLLTFLLPLYWIVFRKKRFVVIVSDTTMLAETFVSALKKELEENPRLRADFGDLCGDRLQTSRRLKWTTSDITTAHTDAAGTTLWSTRVLARSTGSQFRGLRNGAYRPDAILCDDLENDELVATPEMRTKTWDWFTKVVLPALDPKQSSLIVIGTILHFDSLLNRLLKQAEADGVYDWRLYRAIDEQERILWPERFDHAFFAQRKHIMGTLAFNSEYLNYPIDETTRIFRPAWPRWYTRHELEHDDRRGRWIFRGEPLEIVIGVDPAISERDSADYFAYVVLGVARAQRATVVLQTFANRLDFPAQVQTIIHQEATWQPKYIGIEEQAYQKALPQQLLKESFVLGTKLRALKNGASNKYQRIVASSVAWENGTVYLRQALDDEAGSWDELGQRKVHHLMLPLYTQMMQYPASAHDDVLDACENAFQLATSKPRIFEDWDDA